MLDIVSSSYVQSLSRNNMHTSFMRPSKQIQDSSHNGYTVRLTSTDHSDDRFHNRKIPHPAVFSIGPTKQRRPARFGPAACRPTGATRHASVYCQLLKDNDTTLRLFLSQKRIRISCVTLILKLSLCRFDLGTYTYQNWPVGCHPGIWSKINFSHKVRCRIKAEVIIFPLH